MPTTAPTNIEIVDYTKSVESPSKITTRELSFSSQPSSPSTISKKPGAKKSLLVQPKPKEYFIEARKLFFEEGVDKMLSVWLAGNVAKALFGAEPKASPPVTFRPFVKTQQELDAQVSRAVAIAKEKPAAGPPTRAANMGGQVRLVARVITDERFIAADADASLKGVELEVDDQDRTVAPPYAAWLEPPSGRDQNAEPFAPAPKEGVVLREGLEEAKLDTTDAEATWERLVSRGGDEWALGWTCVEAERDIIAYEPHAIIANRARGGPNEDGCFETGIVWPRNGWTETEQTIVVYDVALPLRETGLIQRDVATEAQVKIADARAAKWGAQLAPEAVRARRLAKLAKRFKTTVPPAFFREYVRVDDTTPRSDKAADAAYWEALSAAGAPYVILPTGKGRFGKAWPAPVWGVCAAYEKRHGPPPTKHVAKIARSDWREIGQDGPPSDSRSDWRQSWPILAKLTALLPNPYPVAVA